MSDNEAVRIIKENLKIAEFIGRYTELARKGSRLSGLCPIHREKTPSFYVDDQKGLFHCFGCGAGGDIIRFAQEIERLEFVEALDFLAEIAGVTLPKARGGPGRDVIDSLRAIYREAAAFYRHQLHRHQPARAYLDQRGIRESTSDLFKVGWAGNQWDGLYQHLKGKFDERLLEQSGLFKTGKSGGYYDIFRERLIFPIFDSFGYVVAFGGRLIDQQEGPKYINSPETALYTKGRHLYNLHFAKPFLEKNRTAIVVEGYLDAIQVYQSGQGGVIASLGTAFTQDQAKVLKRYVQKVILNFDGDKAGFKAAYAAIATFLRNDLEIGVVVLPDGLDPDDYIRQHGAAAYRDRTEQSVNFFDFIVEYLVDGKDVSQDARHCSFVAQEVCAMLMAIDDVVLQNFYLDKLSEVLHLSRHVVQQIFTRQVLPVVAAPRAAERAKGAQPVNCFNRIEQQFLYLVMHQPEYDSSLTEEDKAQLPKILATVFRQHPWILDFIHGDRELALERQLEVVAEEYRAQILSIYFSEHLHLEDPQQIHLLFEDLCKDMLAKRIAMCRQQLKALPIGDEAKIKECRNQLYRLTKRLKEFDKVASSAG